MVRSFGIAAVVVGLAWTGLVGAQTASPLEKARYIQVSEEGKPPQRCKLIKTWRQANGTPVFQVQAVDTGEMMTIVGTCPQEAGSNSREMSTRIFRWGRDNKPPTGAPRPPADVASATTPSAPADLMQKTPNTKPQPIRPAPIVQVQPAPAKPAAAPQPIRPVPVAAAPKPMPVPAAERKPNQPHHLTPMGTQIVQYSSPSTPRKGEYKGHTPDTFLPAADGPRLKPLPAGSVVSRNSCDSACSSSCEICGKPCAPCSQSCICDTPSPMRQPLISRLFNKSNSSCACTPVECPPVPSISTPSVPTSSESASAAKPASPTPPAPVAAKPATEPAKPGDWRQSWGQVESWKAPPPANNEPVIRHDVVEAKPASRHANAKTVQLETPKQPSPIQDPKQYRDLALSARPANSKIPQENGSSHRPRLVSKPQAVKTNAAPPSDGLPPPQMIVISADEPNAFWSPQQPGTPSGRDSLVAAPNAFAPPAPPGSGERDAPQPGVPPSIAGIPPNVPVTPPPIIPGYMQGPPPQGLVLKNPPCPPTAPWTAPPGPARPMPPDAGVPDAMGNAFTLAATRRPIPADFGGTPQEPNGFDPPVQMGGGSPPRAYAMPIAPSLPRQGGGSFAPTPAGAGLGWRPPQTLVSNPLMNVPPSVPTQMGMSAAATTAPASPAGVPQLLAALKDSLRPSEREAAAEQLSELNWRYQPLVVESLMKSAHDDPAATVRAACIHALARMKVATPAATALVQQLKSDRDPRVRQEAEEALNALGDPGVQQASHK